MDQGDGVPFGWGNGPTAAQKVDLGVGIDAAAQRERPMQIQERGGWARPDRRASFDQSLVPGRIGAGARGTADRVIGVIVDLLVSQDRHQALW